MGKKRRPTTPWWTWCWRCGRDFQTRRAHTETCGPTCRQQVRRLICDDMPLAIVYPFRWGPKRGRFSEVTKPDNLTMLPALRRREL
jgi:hypothetical protein